MVECYIDSHSSYCLAHDEKYKKLNGTHKILSFNPFEMCSINPERFLFFIKNKFVLITYHNCIHNGLTHLEFKQDLINSIIVKNKIYDVYDLERIHLDRILKEYRLRNKNLKKYHNEINFIYSDNAGKQYAITNRIPFMDSIINQDEILSNYKICKDYLIKNGLEHLIKELDELYNYNHFFEFDKIEVFKTIEHLIDNIKKL